MPPMASTPVRPEQNLKRRRIRKGTSSCWECKHRKRRCDFEPYWSSVCVSCQRRGIPCISQEYTEPANDEYEPVAHQIDRVEDLVQQLVRHRGNQSRRTNLQETIGETMAIDVSKYSTLRSVSHERMSRCSSLIGYLNATLPAPHITATIFNSSKQHDAPLQILQNISPGGDCFAEQGTQIPDTSPTIQPVAFARRLIKLALCLQELDTGKSRDLGLDSEEPVLNTARRYFQTASNLVMSQDYLVSSLDGLETLMLQSRYHISIGELHIARKLYKRASHIAHLMNLSQQAKIPGTRANSIWFQMVYNDCFLSLALGQPIAIFHDIVETTESPTINTPAQNLERTHVAIARRIVTRNLHLKYCREREILSTTLEESYRETKTLDFELKIGSRTMPTSWWIPPSFSSANTDREAMEKTAKLLIQTHQYYLLVLLHQPYIIPGLPCNGMRNGCDQIEYTYSTLAVVAASREVLTRYIILRNFHQTSSYRGFDDKAFTASVGLLFAHLVGHRHGSANVLEHQRPHDLGMLENVISCMEKVSSTYRDSQGTAKSQTLRRFVKIEADAADGSNFLAWGAGGVDDHKRSDAIKSKSDLEIPIPYFGILHITRQARGQCMDASTATHVLAAASEISLPTLFQRQGRDDMPGQAFGALNTTYEGDSQLGSTSQPSTLNSAGQTAADAVTFLDNCLQDQDSAEQTSLYNGCDPNWLFVEDNEILGNFAL